MSRKRTCAISSSISFLTSAGICPHDSAQVLLLHQAKEQAERRAEDRGQKTEVGGQRSDSLIPPPANHYYSAHEHCTEDERSTNNCPGPWALAQREHHPDRIQYRLDQRN